MGRRVGLAVAPVTHAKPVATHVRPATRLKPCCSADAAVRWRSIYYLCATHKVPVASHNRTTSSMLVVIPLADSPRVGGPEVDPDHGPDILLLRVAIIGVSVGHEGGECNVLQHGWQVGRTCAHQSA